MKMYQPVRSPGSHRGLRARPSMSLAMVDLWSATAGRRIETHRTNHRRAVYVYRASTVKVTEDAEWDGPILAMARLSRLRTRAPFNPVGATVFRPVTDATNTLNILREVLRGPR